MRILRRLGALAAGFVALGALAMPTMASASSSQPSGTGYTITQVNPTTYIGPVVKAMKVSPLIAAWKICTRSGTQRCMASQGVGQQFRMHDAATGYSTFSDLGGTFGDVFETPGGLCPHAADGANSYVVTGETACSTNNQAYQWFVTNDSPNRLLNPLYNRYLAVLFNDQNGARTTTQPGTGAFYLGRFGS